MRTAAALVFAAVSLLGSAQDTREALENYQTSVTVYGERLPAAQRSLLDTAAPVAVVTREQIEASGARTVQEVLETLPGVTLHDQTGNPREATVDLRAFPQGTSVAVFLDGVRLNDLQDNAVRWDTLPVEDLERVEVYAGASAPLYGGGALAGVVNLVTKRDPGIPRLDLRASAGSYGGRAERLHAAGTLGRVEFYAAAQHDASDGWRQNDGFRLDDALLRFNVALPKSQSVALLLKYSGGAEQDPGALTPQEYAADPAQTPFNRFDGTRGRHRIAALSYAWEPEEGSWSAGARAYARRHDRDTLTTGRFGSGFLAVGRESLDGLIATLGKNGARSAWSWELSGGAEVSSGRFDGTGYFTDIRGEDRLLVSQTATAERFRGAWISGDLGYKKIHAVAGFRADRASYDYEDRLYPAADTSRDFSETTARLGLLAHAGENASLFLTWSQGYRIPSVTDLFAYPGFFSNPDLRPARAEDWEGGWRYLRGGYRFSVTLFRMAVRDEVVFVLTDPVWFIGQNQNVGRSRRRGVEAQASAPLGAGFALFASGAYTEADVTAGPYAGRRIPMAPRLQATGGATWARSGWSVRLAARYVGPQRLDSDLENLRDELPGYALVDVAAGYRWRALTVQASVANLLDRRYAGRGITNGYADFWTPAAPRFARLSVMWSF